MNSKPCWRQETEQKGQEVRQRKSIERENAHTIRKRISFIQRIFSINQSGYNSGCTVNGTPSSVR